GTIDRVDASAAPGARSLRVVNYKRSKRTADASAADLGETALQVPLYARAAAAALAAAGAFGVYLPTGARDVRAFRVKDAYAKRWSEALAVEGEEGRARVEAHALALVRQMRDGAL